MTHPLGMGKLQQGLQGLTPQTAASPGRVDLVTDLDPIAPPLRQIIRVGRAMKTDMAHHGTAGAAEDGAQAPAQVGRIPV